MHFSIFSFSHIVLHFIIVIVILIKRNHLQVVEQDISTQKEEMTRRINQGRSGKTRTLVILPSYSYFPTARASGDCPSYENLCFQKDC